MKFTVHIELIIDSAEYSGVTDEKSAIDLVEEILSTDECIPESTPITIKCGDISRQFSL